MAARMWVLLLDGGDVWHRPRRKSRTETLCGQTCVQVRRLSEVTPTATDMCETCGQGVSPSTDSSASQTSKPSKAVRKKAAELRAQGVRAEVAEALAEDALAPGNHHRSVRATSGGLPTLGRRR